MPNVVVERKFLKRAISRHSPFTEMLSESGPFTAFFQPEDSQHKLSP